MFEKSRTFMRNMKLEKSNLTFFHLNLFRMTTSLSKSTIPEYDPNNSYSSPRQIPRVKSEAQENYLKSRGSLNIGRDLL